MMAKGKIAVIIVDYYGLSDTRQCIKSVQNSTVQSTVIVVDNSGKKKLEEKISVEFPDVIVLSPDKNLGFSDGNNLGLQYAQTHGFSYVMLLNNDTVIDRQMIEHLMREQTGTNLCVPTMFYFDHPDKVWYGGGRLDWRTGSARHLQLTSDSDLAKNQPSIECNFATGCCMLFSINLYLEIGGLSSDYFMYCEDVDFCIRMQNTHHAIVYVPSAKLLHKVSSSSGGDASPLSIYYVTRNKLIYLNRYKSNFFKGAMLLTLLTRGVRIMQFLVRRDIRWKAMSRGIIDYFRGKIGQADYDFFVK